MGDKVAIFGWYGSETLGDKAILGGIIERLVSQGVQVDNISLLSFNVNYSKLTMIDLEFPSIDVLDLYDVKHDIAFISQYDTFIMGGGPLCDIEELIYILEIFENAKNNGKKTIIYSCGVGPLNIEKYKYVFTEILSLSDVILFRDDYTPQKYLDLIKSHNYDVAIDPAFNYIVKHKDNVGEPIITGQYVMFCLRKWPELYSYGITQEENNRIVQQLELLIVDSIRHYYQNNIKVVLFPMHNYYFGDDDREYFMDLCDKYDLWNQVEIIGHEYTVKESLNYFKYATKVFAMRFHSVVFSIALQTEFIALDYQIDDGKITGVLDMLGLSNKTLKMSSFSQDVNLTHELKEIEQQRVDWNKVNTIINEQIAKLV